MSNDKELCDEARRAFEKRGHKASLVLENEDVSIIDWINGHGGSDYYVRFILSRSNHRQNLCVMGDLGEAVFEMFWNRENFTVRNFSKMVPEANIDYFFEKLQAASNMYDYDREIAEEDLRLELKDYLEDWAADDVDSFIEDVMEDFGWHGFGSIAYDRISDLDSECFEWIDRCGRSIHMRFYLWIVGLIMACEQLEKEDAETHKSEN